MSPYSTLDLFKKNIPKKIFTVTQINEKAHFLLEKYFCNIYVKGEISDYKQASSGHHYFTLKDKLSSLNAVLFYKKNSTALGFAMKEGLNVEVKGRLTIYNRSGRYQIIIEDIRLYGLGDLQAKLDILKNKLREEGLFNSEKKRPLPLLPRKTAILTSLQGAVIKDFIHVAIRRLQNPHILLIPVQVQGQFAADSIIKGIEQANHLLDDTKDVIIIARGGGSSEDINCFNHEKLAYTIAQSRVPIVSAIGHETDFTICDFVADQRASTPSVAAELIFPDKKELFNKLSLNMKQITLKITHEIKEHRYRINKISADIKNKKYLINIYRQNLDDIFLYIKDRIKNKILKYRSFYIDIEKKLSHHNPQNQARLLRQELIYYSQRIDKSINTILEFHRQKVYHINERINNLSPLSVLQRGYSITQSSLGNIIRDKKHIKVGEKLNILLNTGSIKVRVEDII